MNKVIKPFRIYLLQIVIFSTGINSFTYAQDSTYKRPVHTSKWKEYRGQVRDDSTKRMVELQSLMPGLKYDLRYATKNNFMKRQMYPSNTRTSYLRIEVAQALKNALSDLNQKGYGLKIFDAYRPFSVTELFWNLVKDERYVANPSKGSGHNRGIAVDLTLTNLLDGQEMDMGTGFDNFTDTAHSTFRNLPQHVLNNRDLLRTTMEKHGFKVLDTEWWHFFIPGSSRYEILDLEFKQLAKKL